ncbi:unnamed protein product [Candidula unifasciata]|uniref:SAND domain-containing protein n=1 Tax=Candidula unifasciata TaxID=100452 RepID=A0A8S3ZFJ4_9EUPU|nr:unnamed protein product [Candidula unifasciata]
MNIQRTIDNSCELRPTISTLHIPVSSAFIPFQQFSLSDGTTIRNPADDNNNKTLPVVSVVATVTGLCPAVSMVSMHQPTQLAQTSTIIPTVMTPIAVQAANCLVPTTMTVSNAVNISNRLSVPTNHQQTMTHSEINIGHQTGSIINNNIINHNIITTSCPLAPQGLAAITSTAPGSAANSNKFGKSPSITPNNIAPAKSSQPNNTSSSSKSSNSPKVTSTTSTQGSNSEQTDDLVKPVFKDGELVLEVECGQNKAILYLTKLCQGSKGPCINFQNSWLTPNEFQFVSGRETAKDWKRSIRHHGKSLKLLLAKGILNVHPTMCDCDGCRQGATLTRKGEKRRIPNGERKIKKPSNSCSSASNCAEGSGIRSGTAPVVAAHLGAAGFSQVKPEMAQMAQSNKVVQSLNAVLNSQPSQTQTNASSSSAVQLAFPPPDVTSSLTVISEFPSSTSTVMASQQTVSQTSASTDVSTSKTPQTITVATPVSLQKTSNATVESTTAGPIPSAPELHIHHLTLNPALLQILSPNHPNAKEAQTPTPTTCDFTELPNHSSDIGPNDSGLSDDDDEDINVGNNTDASFNTEGNCDIPDEDSDDECHYSNKISEDDDDDSICDAHSTEEASPEAIAGKADASTQQTAYSNSFYSGLAACEQKSVPDTRDYIHKINSNVEGQEHFHELKKHSDLQEPGSFPKTSTPISNIGGVYDSSRQTEVVSLYNVCPATATLSISAVSSACSKPLSLSISTSNVKSEHLWIPPTVSSSSTNESTSIHEAQQDSARNSRSPQAAKLNRRHITARIGTS